MPNTQMPPPALSKTYKLSPNTQDEQIQTEALIVPDVPMVENEKCPSSMMCDNDPIHPLTALTSPSSVLWGPAPPPWIFDNYSDKLVTLQNHAFATHYLCSSTPAHAGETREPGDLKDDVKAVEINEQATWQREVVVGGAGVTEDIPELLKALVNTIYVGQGEAQERRDMSSPLLTSLKYEGCEHIHLALPKLLPNCPSPATSHRQTEFLPENDTSMKVSAPSLLH